MCNLYELRGRIRIAARFCRHDLHFEFLGGVVEVQRGEALLGGLFQVLHQALVARVVGNHELEVGMRFYQLALLVQRQVAAVVSQGMDDDGRILARFDHLVEIADRANARRRGQRAVLPPGAVLVEQVAADEIRGRHVFIARDGDKGLPELP